MAPYPIPPALTVLSFCSFGCVRTKETFVKPLIYCWCCNKWLFLCELCPSNHGRHFLVRPSWKVPRVDMETCPFNELNLSSP